MMSPQSMHIESRLLERRKIIWWSTAFLATLRKSDSNEEIECAILIPDLTRHIDVVEVISIDYLREKLGLTDGDEVTLTAH